MAMLSSSGSGPGRRGRRKALNAEINITPMVDVMLVLLIIFMVTAPLLATGVDVSLPKTKAETMPAASEQPLTVSIAADGRIFVQKEAVAPEELVAKLEAIARAGYEERIYLRLDESVPSGISVDVMARMQLGGFRNIAIMTDPRTE